MQNPVKAAAEVLGSQKALAAELGVDPSFVSQWASGHRKIPPVYCKKIELLTSGAISREILRPDIFE